MSSTLFSNDQIKKIKDLGSKFREWENSEEGQTQKIDHQNHVDIIKKQCSRNNLEKLTEESLIELYNELWSNGNFTNKEWRAREKIIKPNGIKKISDEFIELLYGIQPISERYNRCNANLLGVAKSTITELLYCVDYSKYCLWNDPASIFIAEIGFGDDLSRFKSEGEKYARLLEIYSEILKILIPYNIKNFFDLDTFMYYVFDTRNKKSTAIKSEFWQVSAGEKDVKEKVWNEFKNSNSVGVFWNDTGDVTNLSRDEIKSKFEELKIEKGASSVFNFKKIKKNDIIFVNDGKRGLFGIGKAVGDYRYDINHSYHHMVPVEWITTDYIETDDIPGNPTAAATRINNKEPYMKYLSKMPQNDSELNLIIETLKQNGQIVLYGPPGTSKTFTARKIAVQMLSKESVDDKNISELFKNFQNEGVVDLVQFHPSYSYEDFVQGIKPTTNPNGSISYQVRDGIFKKICEKSAPDGSSDGLRAMVKSYEKIEKPFLAEEINFKFSEAAIRKVDKPKFEEALAIIIKNQKSVLLDSMKNINNFFFLYTKQLSDYWDDPEHHYGFRKGIPGSNQIQEALEGENEAACIYYNSKKGGFFGMAILDKVVKNETKNQNYKILIIDEINRGNLSKIFGELIYALEYRGEQVRLQYADFDDDDSNNFLTVPENLYIIGTMNTADRSISLFDTAMRRRFAFLPMMVNYELVTKKIGLGLEKFNEQELKNKLKSSISEHEKKSILSLLAVFKLNQKISEQLRMGREKQIGHTYLLKIVNDKDQFLNVWKYQIIPLLEEFYASKFDDLEEILNENIIDKQMGLKDFSEAELLDLLNLIIST